MIKRYTLVTLKRYTLVVLTLLYVTYGEIAGAQTAQPAMETAKPPGHNEGRKLEAPTTVIADELLNDQTERTLIASGHVEIDYGDRLILADSVTYHADTRQAVARGHVVIVDRDGTTTFADYAEVTGDLKKAFLQGASVALKDGSASTAGRLSRQDGNLTDLLDAAYNPCAACLTDPQRPPIWRIKAVHIIHDQTEHNLYFRDATLEAFGVPVAYSPYFSLPDPSVERRSGLLGPLYRGNTYLGVEVGTPYYYVIDRAQDIIVTPIITTQQGEALALRYRYANRELAVDLKGAVAQSPTVGVRDYITGTGVWNINSSWRAGAEVGATSDTTFMRTYGFGQPSYLTTHPYVEGFTRRSYVNVEAYSFNNLIITTANNASSPLAGPLAAWNYTSATDGYGQWTTSNVTTATLYSPTDQSNSRRLSADVGWHAPWLGPLGDTYRLDVNARSDLYNVDKVTTSNTSALFTGSTSRFIPTAAATWGLPLIKHHDSFTETVTPTIQAVLAAPVSNNGKIPNQDSQGFRFDDTNLFAVSRMPGYDLVESGSRVNFGTRWNGTFLSGSKIDALVGGSWHHIPNNIYNSGDAGRTSPWSDYVGSLGFHPGYTIDATYQQRLNQSNFSSDWNELTLSVGPPILRASSSYIYDRGIALVDSSPNPVNQFATSVSSAISQFWSISGSTRWDLGGGTGPLQAGGSVRYEDDCLNFAVSAIQSYTYTTPETAARSVTSLYRGGLTIGFQVTLKTIGGSESGAF